MAEARAETKEIKVEYGDSVRELEVTFMSESLVEADLKVSREVRVVEGDETLARTSIVNTGYFRVNVGKDENVREKLSEAFDQLEEECLNDTLKLTSALRDIVSVCKYHNIRLIFQLEEGDC